jgi:sugar lactone lactonase YvrE
VLAIVCGHSLRRRAPDGELTTVATSEFAFSCCMAVGDQIYVKPDGFLVAVLGTSNRPKRFIALTEGSDQTHNLDS